jgi:hypothetical protein
MFAGLLKMISDNERAVEPWRDCTHQFCTRPARVYGKDFPDHSQRVKNENKL